MPDQGTDPQPTADDLGRPTPGDTGNARPEVAVRMTPQLRFAQVGNGVAVLALVFSVVAVVTFPTAGGGSAGQGSTGRGWAVSALAASVAMLVICTVQQLCWLRAMAGWRGRRVGDVTTVTRVSFVLELVSYPVVLFGLWAGTAGSVAAGTTATSSALLAFALLFLVVAQVLGAVQHVRTSGPSGTIPAYLRRLLDAIQRRR